MTGVIPGPLSGGARPDEIVCKTDKVRLLLDRMAATLVSCGCRCIHDSPYTPHVVVTECARCRCLREYREMR